MQGFYIINSRTYFGLFGAPGFGRPSPKASLLPRAAAADQHEPGSSASRTKRGGKRAHEDSKDPIIWCIVYGLEYIKILRIPIWCIVYGLEYMAYGILLYNIWFLVCPAALQ